MGNTYAIAGHAFRRRSIVKLTPDERAALARDGTATLSRPVEWPFPHRTAFMDRAYLDPGNTDLWGPGPYLKMPNIAPGDDEEVVYRVFCPWGYPPDPIRASRGAIRMRLKEVHLVQVARAKWEWRLTVKT